MAVKVESIKWHTYQGKEYPVGAIYDVPDDLAADSVAHQGRAIRTDRVAHAKAAEKAVEKTGKRSTAVAPMTTTSTSSRALAKPRKAKK